MNKIKWVLYVKGCKPPIDDITAIKFRNGSSLFEDGSFPPLGCFLSYKISSNEDSILAYSVDKMAISSGDLKESKQAN